MVRFTETKERWPGKGEWMRTSDPSTGSVNALIGCPSCGQVGHLSHEIKEDGTVSPSIVCPYAEEKGCTFHDHGVLVGWKG